MKPRSFLRIDCFSYCLTFRFEFRLSSWRNDCTELNIHSPRNPANPLKNIYRCCAHTCYFHFICVREATLFCYFAPPPFVFINNRQREFFFPWMWQAKQCPLGSPWSTFWVVFSECNIDTGFFKQKKKDKLGVDRENFVLGHVFFTELLRIIKPIKKSSQICQIIMFFILIFSIIS